MLTCDNFWVFTAEFSLLKLKQLQPLFLPLELDFYAQNYKAANSEHQGIYIYLLQ